MKTLSKEEILRIPKLKEQGLKAAEVAKQVDAQVAPADAVTIQTPEGQPNIVVPGTK